MGIKIWLYYVCLPTDRNSWLHNGIKTQFSEVCRHLNFKKPVRYRQTPRWGLGYVQWRTWVLENILGEVTGLQSGIQSGFLEEPWQSRMKYTPNSKGKCRDVLKSILISSTDGSILEGFMGQDLAFVLSKKADHCWLFSFTWPRVVSLPPPPLE